MTLPCVLPTIKNYWEKLSETNRFILCDKFCRWIWNSLKLCNWSILICRIFSFYSTFFTIFHFLSSNLLFIDYSFVEIITFVQEFVQHFKSIIHLRCTILLVSQTNGVTIKTKFAECDFDWEKNKNNLINQFFWLVENSSSIIGSKKNLYHNTINLIILYTEHAIRDETTKLLSLQWMHAVSFT